ncbi:MAG: polysaccharide deacetylase family protein [Bacteroidota bacterium]
MKYLYTPPSLVRKIFSDFQWNSSCNKILLTFDDGPTEECTEEILNELNRHGIKAVFFTVGNNVRKYPELVRLLIEQGHAIGNHTVNHQDIWFADESFIKKEVEDFNVLMKDKFDYDVKYFRPPHGRFDHRSSKILKVRGLKIVMWSLLTVDYKNNFNTVKYAVNHYLRRNSIVVLHDNVKSSSVISDSINYLVERAKANNYQFGDPAECLK